MRCSWRWCGGEDMSIDLLYHEQISFGVCTYGVRQLRRDCYVSLNIACLEQVSSGGNTVQEKGTDTC